MPIVRRGSLTVGFVAPCLEEGGAENWQLNLIDAVNNNPPTGGVTWQGCAVLDDPTNASTAMLAATRAKLPVVFGEDALYSMASFCQVLISWAVYPFQEMAAIMTTMPILIFARHRSEAWSATASTYLTPAAAVVACSPIAATAIPSSFSSRSSTILNAIDPARLTASVTKSAKRSAWGVPANSTVVGFLGRLEPERDPLAMGRLATAIPAGTWAVVVGEGSLAGELAASGIAGGGSANLILTGADADAGSCVNAFDWLISPPLVESFGYSTAEAWWSGVPVIATAHGLAGLNPSLVRTVADNASSAVLAAALASDIADPSGTASRVAAAQSWANSNLSPGAFGTSWTNLLVSLAGQGGGGGD